MNWLAKVKSRPFFIKLFNWEYWPSYAFYAPLLPYFLLQVARYRHLFFFTTANPGLDTGGSGLESKFKTLGKLPPEYCPKSILTDPSEDFAVLSRRIRESGIRYPLIAKPDVGLRGFLVKKIPGPQELEDYLQILPIPFIIQEYIALQNEYGVFYVRYPGEDRGRVTSITLKEFLSVTGDGTSTVAQLVKNKPRARLQWPRLLKTHKHLLETIPTKGTRVPLGVIGNHSKGTTFINGNHLIDERFHQTFDRISKQIEGFHFGRYDIKCNSLEDLQQGKNLMILELNGVCAEPTYIYDTSKCTYFGAIREIKRHWRIIHQLSYINFKNGAKYDNTWEMLGLMLNLRRYTKRMNRRVAELKLQGVTK